jgi:hypothetical protein
MGQRGVVLIVSLVLVTFAAGCGQAESPQPETAAGWKKFGGAGVDVWLPDSYEGGDLTKDLPVMVEKVRALGPGYEEMARTIERNPGAFRLWAFDAKIGASGGLTNLTLVAEGVPSTVSIETYLGMVGKQLPKHYRVVEQSVAPLALYNAGRLVMEAEFGGARVRQVAYVVKSDSTMWVLNYSTPADEFDERLSSFEASAHTFSIQQKRSLWQKARDTVLGVIRRKG